MSARRNVRGVYDISVPTHSPDKVQIVLAYSAPDESRSVVIHLDGAILSLLTRKCLDALALMVVHAQSNLDRAKRGGSS